MTIDSLHTENAQYKLAIIQISHSDYIRISKIKIVNVMIRRRRLPIIAISSSNNIQISLLNVENINETVLKITSSKVDNIDSLDIKN